MSSQQLQSFMVPGARYGYTGAAIDTIQSFQNTLAMGLLDESGSTGNFAKPMEACCKEIIKALRHSPVKDNVIYRQSHFGTEYREVHGFIPINNINVDIYDGCYQPGGRTILYDANDRALKELRDYATQQVARKYSCNAFLYTLTDGRDYGSSLGQPDVRQTFIDVNGSEVLESFTTVLIGVNDDDAVQRDLKDYAAFVGYTQYIPLKDANEKTLAKICNFVSKSIQACSVSLVQGTPSQPPTF